MSRAQALVDDALTHGDKRSAVYRQGAVDVLLLKLEGHRIQCPYRAGSVEFDAYFSGNDRGFAIWRRFNEEKTEDEKPRCDMRRHEAKSTLTRSPQSPQ